MLQAHQDTPALRASESILHLQVAADGTNFQQWLGQLDRDNRQRVLLYTTKGLVIHDYPEYLFAHDTPKEFYGEECKGLAFAAENNLLAWSFDATGQWTEARYRLVCRAYNEATDEVDDEESAAWHLPATGETLEHASYFAGALDAEKRRIVEQAGSSSELLRHWDEWFPALTLTDVARTSLAELPTDAVRPVAERLIALQRLFATWSHPHANYNLLLFYRANIESDSRLQKIAALKLRCPDGQIRPMSWHMRYPPVSGGRFYFVPDAATSTCFIGYIGPKIT